MKISVLLPIACLGLAVSLGGCDLIDPFEKPGVWQPMGANDMNFELQVARPGDLAQGRGTTDTDGDTAAQAVDRLRHDKVKPLVATSTEFLRWRGGAMTSAAETAPRLSAADLPAGVGRHDRPALIAFVDDAATETALREGLSDVVQGNADIRRGGVKAAVNALRKSATPRVLIVDVSAVEQPLSALHDLSFVTEPDVRVLVIGVLENLDFYREVTRGLGALEYLTKPVSRDTISRHFAPLIVGRAPMLETGQGGRVLSITGARGGVGATTIAVNLVWHFGVSSDRHTVLLDPDLHRGTAAMLLDSPAGPGLRMALESPDRIDELFVERSAQPVSARLHVLSGEMKLAEQPGYTPNAAQALLGALTQRYNFVVADVPFAPHPLYRDLLDLSHQRILVLEPTLACVRDTLRLLALPAGAEQSRRPLLVLNRLGQRGALPRRKIEEALKTKVDVVIPDLPRVVETAATMGEAIAAHRNGFRRAIVELAGLTASLRLLDASSSNSAADQPTVGRRRFNLFRRK